MDTASAEKAVHDAALRQTQEMIAELEDMALDPTLDQCCRRDIESQIAKERIRHSLQLQDRIDARQRVASAVICRDAAALASALSTEELQLQFLGDSDGLQNKRHHPPQEDSELLELRQQRLAQLQAQTALNQNAQQAGFGTLNTVQEERLKALISDSPGRGLLVVHLAVQGHEPCNVLDECLEAAATQYRGTYFARCVVSRNTELVARLQLPQGVPALLVCKEGSILGKAHITQFGGHDVWDEEVMSYLRRFKVLSSGDSARSGSSRPGQAEDDGDDGSDGDSDTSQPGDWAVPCEICGRTYAHTHVRALYSTQQSDSDEED